MYEPLEQAKPFHQSKAKVRILVGGFRAGVSFAACHEFVKMLKSKKGSVGLVVGPDSILVSRVCLPLIQDALHGEKVYTTWKNKRENIPDKIFARALGFRIDFKSSSKLPASPRGYDVVWIDCESYDTAFVQECTSLIWSLGGPGPGDYETVKGMESKGAKTFHFTTAGNLHLSPSVKHEIEELINPGPRPRLPGEFVIGNKEDAEAIRNSPDSEMIALPDDPEIVTTSGTVP